VFEGIRATLIKLHERKPNARIILQSLPPTQDEAKTSQVVRPTNQCLLDLAQAPPLARLTSYLGLYADFGDASGQQIASRFNDSLHPNQAGYRVWRDRIVPFLQAARARAPATRTPLSPTPPTRTRSATTTPVGATARTE
jgi:lysophospholipase L1-like esterase